MSDFLFECYLFPTFAFLHCFPQAIIVWEPVTTLRQQRILQSTNVKDALMALHTLKEKTLKKNA